MKTCSKCETRWPNAQAILDDDNVRLIGYQPDFKNPHTSFFMFFHDKDDCRTSFTVKVTEFFFLIPDLVNVEPFESGSDGCEGLCKSSSELTVCENTNCTGAAIRKLLGIISEKKRKKVEL